MNEKKEYTKFGKFISATLLVSGFLALFLGAPMIYQSISIVLSVGLSEFVSELESIQIIGVLVSIFVVPIVLTSFYYIYILINKKILSRGVIYSSILQGLILIYPILHICISDIKFIKNGILIEYIVICSVTILGVVLVFQGLYGFWGDTIS